MPCEAGEILQLDGRKAVVHLRIGIFAPGLRVVVLVAGVAHEGQKGADDPRHAQVGERFYGRADHHETLERAPLGEQASKDAAKRKAKGKNLGATLGFQAVVGF